MASNVIRRAWFSWPAKLQIKVPPSGVGPPQVSEANWLASLGGNLTPGTRTTTPAGAVTVGNVVSSNPAAGTTQNAGTAVAYVVAV